MVPMLENTVSKMIESFENDNFSDGSLLIISSFLQDEKIKSAKKDRKKK